MLQQERIIAFFSSGRIGFFVFVRLDAFIFFEHFKSFLNPSACDYFL
jgi:hypothetical protein